MEFHLDFSVLADVDPYLAPTGFEYSDSTAYRILSGKLVQNVAGDSPYLISSETQADKDIVRSSVITGFSNTNIGASVQFGLLDADLNGYFLIMQGRFGYWRTYTDGTSVGTVGSTNGDLSYSDGTEYAIEVQKSTGRVELFRNGVSVSSVVDNVHSAKDLRPSFRYLGDDTQGIRGFKGTAVSGTDYTIRKGATAVPITHTLTAGGITSQTFNGETVALASQSGQIANVDFTDTITTSGVYTLTLGDGATTQNFDVQYNVIGLTSDQLLKDGAAQASLSDLELIVLTGAEGSRAVPEQESSLTTDASGNTGQTILNDTGIVDATAVFVIWNSASADTRWAYPTTAGLL